MSTGKTGNRYNEGFKRTLGNLYQSGGKSQAALCKEYGVSITALGRLTAGYQTAGFILRKNLDTTGLPPHLGQKKSRKPFLISCSLVPPVGSWYLIVKVRGRSAQ